MHLLRNKSRYVTDQLCCPSLLSPHSSARYDGYKEWSRSTRVVRGKAEEPSNTIGEHETRGMIKPAKVVPSLLMSRVANIINVTVSTAVSKAVKDIVDNYSNRKELFGE